MAKPSAKVIAKGNAAAKPRSVSVPDSQYGSVSVRKISNGYLISQSCETNKGYTHTETFSPTKPKIEMPKVTGSKGRK